MMNKKVVFSMLFMIGILSVILSIMVFGMDSSTYVSWKSYGGDAYTGIQNAAAVTANNISDLIDLIAFCGGSILLVGGLAMIASSFKMLDGSHKEECEDETDGKVSENNVASNSNTNYECPNCEKKIAPGQIRCECGQTLDWSVFDSI